MSDSQQAQPAAETPVSPAPCPSLEGRGDSSDPEIAALLDFEPVPRKIAQPGAWTPELQRQFIARLAVHGSKYKACEELGKDRGGVTKLYKSPEGASFRAAWDAAVALAERRKAEELEAVPAGLNPPTLDSRRRSRPVNDHEPEPEPEIDEEEKIRLIENLAAKFMKKVAAEREARLGGEIVAADFYLRQITFLEATFDLTASQFGWDARDLLKDLRRGGQAPE